VVVRLEGEVDELQRQLAAVATSEWDRISRERDEAHRERDAYRDALYTARREVESMGELARATARHAEELRGLLREVQFDAVTSWEWRSRVRAALEGKS
jgi:NTP pyrophosphatase (non-canonical NTP hydrolase)